ncbi:Sen15 protein-domain-containing protein [Massariosphaeria phaeospora]|uniref:Sen15 protein-domain-containing protein n=1 Tax=Massariosphaeria phaeospora TaxID=100035 RepID=A0A7C8MVV6_9PLEO|nr:Sen15 protein-domain-containing protein [Massariosphaeria phaeospora]
MTRPPDMKPAVLPSPLQSLVAAGNLQSSAAHLPSLQSLALQVQHNLQYQHAWSDLRLHTTSPLTNEPLPRPLLSGLPPHRLYVHPDEQIELLKTADRERKARNKQGDTLDVKTEAEHEWILPTRLSEKWTLHRLADVFDALSMVPPAADSAATDDRPANPWRTTKRLVLATAGSDSTVVYYIVHDGVVKPRQN